MGDFTTVAGDCGNEPVPGDDGMHIITHGCEYGVPYSGTYGRIYEKRRQLHPRQSGRNGYELADCRQKASYKSGNRTSLAEVGFRSGDFFFVQHQYMSDSGVGEFEYERTAYPYRKSVVYQGAYIGSHGAG